MRTIILLLIFGLSFYWQSFAQLTAEDKYKAAEKYRKLKKYDAALALYKDAVKLEPNNYKYYFRKGQCEANTQPPQLEAAEESVLTALELMPTFVNGYSFLAQLYTKKKDYESAISALNSAINHETDKAKIDNYKIMILRLHLKGKNTAEALRQIDRMLISKPNDPKLRFIQGEAYEQNGQWKEAAAAYTKAYSFANAPTVPADFNPEDKFEYLYKIAYVNYILGDMPTYSRYAEELSKKSTSWFKKLNESLEKFKGR